MTTDKEQIMKAIAQIAAEEAFIPLREEHFTEVCPNPAWAAHVSGRSAGEAVGRLGRELAQAGPGEPGGLIAYIRTDSMTLADLSRIDGMLPRAPRFRRGLALLPDGSGTDIWIFADAGRDKEES